MDEREEAVALDDAAGGAHLAHDAAHRIAASSRGRSSTISSPRAPSRRTPAAALLHVDARAGQVVDDLAEVRLVTDDEHAPVTLTVGGGQA